MSKLNYSEEDLKKVAETVREQCAKVAWKQFEDASMSGLCAEGAIESAVGAVQALDLDEIIRNIQQNDD